jgi:hypothetical protein
MGVEGRRKDRGRLDFGGKPAMTKARIQISEPTVVPIGGQFETPVRSNVLPVIDTSIRGHSLVYMVMAPYANYSVVDAHSLIVTKKECAPENLTNFEVEDVLESRRQRAAGESRRFTSPEELFAWLNSE